MFGGQASAWELGDIDDPARWNAICGNDEEFRAEARHLLGVDVP